MQRIGPLPSLRSLHLCGFSLWYSSTEMPITSVRFFYWKFFFAANERESTQISRDRLAISDGSWSIGG